MHCSQPLSRARRRQHVHVQSAPHGDHFARATVCPTTALHTSVTAALATADAATAVVAAAAAAVTAAASAARGAPAPAYAAAFATSPDGSASLAASNLAARRCAL